MRTPRLALIVVACATLLAGACSSDEPVVQAPADGTAKTLPPVGGATDIEFAPATRAVVTGPSIEVFDVPEAAEPTQVLENPWLYQNEPAAPIPRVFLVKEERGDWINVYTGVPPSFAEGWVRRDDVVLEPVTFQVDVFLDEFRLVASENGEPFLDTTVAIGTADRPTVGGTYFTTVLLQPPDPDGPYGVYAYGLNGFSDDPAVQAEFGGDGQLGLHGTNEPEKLGTNVSNGCIRLSNEAITQLAAVLPLGTPVIIHE